MQDLFGIPVNLDNTQNMLSVVFIGTVPSVERSSSENSLESGCHKEIRFERMITNM